MAKILIAEREDIIAEDLKKTLTVFGHEITSIVKTPKDIIKRINIDKPELIITEIAFNDDPDDINDFVETIFQVQSSFSIPFIFATAYSSIAILNSILDKGIKPYGYILKPFNDRELEINVELALNEIKKIKNSIFRSIEFAPEHHLAGLNLLSYFAEIVRQKYPNIPVNIKIEQEGLIVRLIIQTPTGEKENIEQTLEKYGNVIFGKIPPEELITNPIKVLELKQQLRIAYLQIENQKELINLSNLQYNNRIDSLESEVKWLRNHVGNVLYYSESNLKTLKNIKIDSFKYLGKTNKELTKSLNLIIEKLERGVSKDDEAETKKVLKDIRKKNSEVYNKVITGINDLIIKGAIAGVSGNLLFEWLKNMLI
jgi:CheY-like chemotaxis protein/soluble P-type ATPase